MQEALTRVKNPAGELTTANIDSAASAAGLTELKPVDYTAVLEKNECAGTGTGADRDTRSDCDAGTERNTEKHHDIRRAGLTTADPFRDTKSTELYAPDPSGLVQPGKGGIPPHLRRVPVCDSHQALFPVCLLLQTFGKNTPGCLGAGLGLGLVTMS